MRMPTALWERARRYAFEHHLSFNAMLSIALEQDVRLQSATENLDDTPAGRFAETTLAAIAQLDNEMRAERAKSGMMAAVGVGRFVWRAPIGYVNGPRNGPSLVPDSPLTSGLVQKAWSLVDSGMPPYEAGVQLVKEGLRLHSGKAPSPRSFRAMLKNERYIGYITSFGKRIRGDFEPLVDPDLFSRVQKVLAKASHSVTRPYKKVNPDFPLRGTVLCPHCGQPLTASWSRGHGGKYPYYRCKHCRGVAVRKETLEPKFIGHLDRLSLNTSMTGLVRKAIEANLGEAAKSNEQTVRQLDAKLEEQRNRRNQIVEKSLKNALPDDDVRRLMEETDRAIQENEAEKGHCLEGQGADLDVVNAGLVLLDKMGSLWAQSDVSIQTQLQRFVFPDGMSFDGERFGTSALPACLQLREEVISPKGRMARPAGVEPATCGSEVRSSIQLSYGR
jgi:site-specific DNA recombinase